MNSFVSHDTDVHSGIPPLGDSIRSMLTPPRLEDSHRYSVRVVVSGYDSGQRQGATRAVPHGGSHADR